MKNELGFGEEIGRAVLIRRSARIAIGFDPMVGVRWIGNRPRRGRHFPGLGLGCGLGVGERGSALGRARARGCDEPLGRAVAIVGLFVSWAFGPKCKVTILYLFYYF